MDQPPDWNPTDDEHANGTAGRDSRTGQFAAGNRFGIAGNPRIARLAELQAVVREVGSPEALRQVLGKLHELALKGDVAAARTWLDRVAGKAELPPIELRHFIDDAGGPPPGPPIPPTKDLFAQVEGLMALVREFRETDAKSGRHPQGAAPGAPPTEPPRAPSAPQPLRSL